MKRCPECRRDYYDETLLYCLDDGSTLLDGPGTFTSDEPATALISDASDEVAASKPTAGSEPTSLQPSRGGRRRTSAILGISALLIGGIALATYLLWPRKKTPAPFTEVKITKLTANGNVSQAVVSRRG